MCLSGDYQCVAENDNGSGVSRVLSIKVLCKFALWVVIQVNYNNTNKQNIDKLMFIYHIIFDVPKYRRKYKIHWNQHYFIIYSISFKVIWSLKVDWLPIYISIFIIEHLVCLDSPVCNTHQQLLGLSLGDKIDIPCRVSANPEDLTFHWFFNKTKDSKVNNNIVFHSR